MPRFEVSVEVERLKNLVEQLGWNIVKEVYQDDHVVVSFVKDFSDSSRTK